MHPNIRNIIANNERIRDFYNIGPVQRAAIEDLITAVANEALDIVYCDHQIQAGEMTVYLDIASKFDKHFTDRTINV